MWIIKIKCFSPRRMLEKNWCIYSCLHNSPERTGFNIYIWEYATVINFPCLITLQGCLKKDSIDLCQKAHPLWNCLTIILFFLFDGLFLSNHDVEKGQVFLEYYMKIFIDFKDDIFLTTWNSLIINWRVNLVVCLYIQFLNELMIWQRKWINE